MWSLGCILGEMIRQKPLFQGTSTINQVRQVLVGTGLGFTTFLFIADRENC